MQIKLSAYLVATLLILSVAAKAIGSLQPINSSLSGFIDNCEGKPTPCWYGILPGTTTAYDGKILMEQAGYKQTSDTSFNSIYVTQVEDAGLCNKVVFLQGGVNGEMIIFTIVLSECPDIRSGDLMSIFRTPSFVSMNMPMLFYGTNGVTTNFDRMVDWDTSVFAEVKSIRLQIGNQWPIIPWKGFIPHWKQCQMEISVPGC
jgi:hypothetical protein